MKIFKQFLFFCFLAVLAACTEDALTAQPEVIPVAGDESVDLISMVVPDIEMDATTRSKLYEDGDQLKFTWQENDAIGVVPMSGNPLRFPIHAENAGKNTALFDGGGWSLKTNTKYAAFFPMKGSNIKDGMESVSFDYEGQTQNNFNDYDFLAACALKPSNGQVIFNMQRLSAILKIKITMPANSYGRYCTLVAPEAAFGVKGTMDLSGTEPVKNIEYSKKIRTDLGFNRVSTREWTYEVYMMIPATDLSGKMINVVITTDSGRTYEANIQGQNFEAGKAYLLMGIADNYYFKNNELVAAAERSGVAFTSTNGKYYVNENLEAIKNVETISLGTGTDPTICDEIGFFKNLKVLRCASNSITSLDLSDNPALTGLYCDFNQLSNLDLTNNPNLQTLYCNNNQLTSLDVSNNTILQVLYCYVNQLTSLDISNTPSLTQLSCYSNQLTSLDISNCPVLYQLSCYSNQLTSLDASNNTALQYLNCASNQLTSLDVSSNTLLTYLYCQSNQLTSLNLDNNKELQELNCGGSNGFTKFTVDTGSNGLRNLRQLNMSNCVSLKELHCYPSDHSSGGNGSLKTLNIYGCTNLEVLNCLCNLLNSLDLSSNTALRFGVSCHNNLLSELYITKNTRLRLGSVLYGSQWKNSNKTEHQDLTLYITSNNGGTLPYQDTYNSGVITQIVTE